MIVVVDQSEKSSNPAVYNFIKKSFSNVIVADLPHRVHGNTKVTAGDINIPMDDGNILAIERKTPEDFLNSIVSGHIFDQVEVMSQHAKYCAIVVTGGFVYSKNADDVGVFTDNEKEIKNTNWKKRGSAVRGAIRTIEASGCPIEFCPPHR